MDKERLCYVSYLLRMWQVRSQDQGIWRASLEYPQTGQVVGFPDLASLFSFLEAQAEMGEEDNESSNHESDNVKTNDSVRKEI